MADDNLVFKSDFQKILNDYQPAPKKLNSINAGKLQPVFLIGPTAAGRNSLIYKLVEDRNYHSIVSHTTRSPRVNNGVLEVNGREYWFISEEEMLAKLQRGEMLEAALIHKRQVSGVSLDELEKAQASNQIAINEIQPNGADSVDTLLPNAKNIFVLPPSYSEWMARIVGRGAPSDQVLFDRMHSARWELSHALTHDYYRFVINDDMQVAADNIDKIARGEDMSQEYYQVARETLKDLLRKTAHEVERLRPSVTGEPAKPVDLAVLESA